MLPIARKPVVQYVVEELEANGIGQVLFVTGKGKTSIENHFDFDHELTRSLRAAGKEELLQELEFERLGLEFFFTRQRLQKGLGDAVRCAQNFTGDRPFVVALGDSVLGRHGSSKAVERLIRCYDDEKASCVVAFQEVARNEVSHYGIARPGGSGDIFPVEDLIEKPSPDEAPSQLAVAARYVLSPSIYDALATLRPGMGGEIQLTDAIRALALGGEKVLGVRLKSSETRYDVGNYESYFRAFLDFALSDPQLGGRLTDWLKERLEGRQK